MEFGASRAPRQCVANRGARLKCTERYTGWYATTSRERRSDRHGDRLERGVAVHEIDAFHGDTPRTALEQHAVLLSSREDALAVEAILHHQHVREDRYSIGLAGI